MKRRACPSESDLSEKAKHRQDERTRSAACANLSKSPKGVPTAFRTFATGKDKAQVRICQGGMDSLNAPSENSPMAKKITKLADTKPAAKSKPKVALAPDGGDRPLFKPTYLGAWIKYLKRKQVEIAEKVDMSESHLSLMIKGKRQYIQSTFDAIADELGIDRAELFRPPPGTVSDWVSLEGLEENERRAARNVVDSFKNKDKDKDKEKNKFGRHEKDE